jgi:predicted HD phosphohydrolase
MADVLELSCVVKDGRIPQEVSSAVRDALRRMEGKRVVVSIRKHVNRRSTAENAYYWAVVVKACQELLVEAGNDMTPEDTHRYLKEFVGGSIFAQVVCTPDGKRRTMIRSSTTLDTREMEDYLERCRVWAAENGREIPLPNESLVH